MSKRLVWNFECSTKQLLPESQLIDPEQDSLKWEARFFWTEDQITTFKATDLGMLELSNYQQKQKKDYYYLLPNSDVNIKIRHEELFYKPLINSQKYAQGFGPKINLSDPENRLDYAQVLLEQIQNHGKEILVKKESFSYKFPSQPSVKMELARIEVQEKIYFSLCIEGKSLYLVERLSQHLLGKPVSCDYISFLKNIIK